MFSALALSLVTQKPFGPFFSHTGTCNDVIIHKLVLDHLGVNSVTLAIGGTMGGMTVLEWSLCAYPPVYVKTMRHSA